MYVMYLLKVGIRVMMSSMQDREAPAPVRVAGTVLSHDV